jgi:hypothetical protein
VSAVATSDRPARVTDPPAAARSAPRLFRPGEISLEDLVLGVWEDLARNGRAECPVCGGRIERGEGCDGCGSELS